MKLAPVIMFVYNRADHFQQTYEALCKCPEVKDTDLYIFSDGPKNDAQVEKVNKVRSFAQRIKDNNPFENVYVIESMENKGLAKSVISGVTEVIEKYGRVIVVEDDCAPASGFLTYMNQCLEYYETEERVGSIAGFTPKLTYPKSFEEDMFFAYRSCSWGWATWKNRWENVDWELHSIKEFYKSPQLIKRLNANGNDRFLRLYRQTKGNGSSWSVRFGAHLVKNDLLTVYPRYSYIQNNGCDESGVHSRKEDAELMSVDLSKAMTDISLCPVSVIPEIQKIMKKHYSAGMMSDIKRGLVTTAIVLKERLKG